MLASQGPKDNANPTVRTVEKDRSRAKREPLQWRQLGEFQRSPFQISSSSSPQAPAYFASQDPQRQEMCWLPTTSEDRSVLNALVDTQVATQGKGVALLSSLGLVIPSSTSDVLKHPHFRAAELIIRLLALLLLSSFLYSFVFGFVRRGQGETDVAQRSCDAVVGELRP